jgi:hypothetical protein
MHDPSQLFLNTVKFNVHTFYCCYLLDVHIGFTPPPQSPNWIAFVLYSSKHTRMHNPSSHFLYFNFQTTLHWHCRMKWNYDIWIHYELIENWMQPISKLQCKCLFATKETALFSCRCNGRAWQWCMKQRIPLLDFFNSHTFTFLPL